MHRRDFLKSAGAASAALVVPWGALDRLGLKGSHGRFGSAEELTTLAQTIVKGTRLGEGTAGAYFALRYGSGEPHLLREELEPRGSGGNRPPHARRSLLHFAHFTDIHVIDAQSPARVEFLDRYSDPGRGCESVPFASAFRPQETLTLQVLEAMIRQLRAIQISPVTGRPVSSVFCTGDNIDNEQLNELRWFIDTMDGGVTLTSNSGGSIYEGVQKAEWADPEYWHPEPSVTDKYKQQYGFPDYPGLLEDALKPFDTTGVGVDWYQTFGNHDGLMQGNAGRNPVFEAVATGSVKPIVLPPGINPCDSFETLRNNPAAILAAPGHPVAADLNRRIVRRAEYVEEMFRSTGTPNGHGFTQANRDSGLAYWHADQPGFRFIGLDTVNPGGYSEGSIGAAQLAWLEARLQEVSSVYRDSAGNPVENDVENRYVIIFSHHGLRSLDNPVIAPDPLEPEANDLPRVMADEIEALVHRYPNVIAWVNGHTHENIIEPRVSPYGGGFWDIGTAAHVDWSCQSRLVEVLDNEDGTLSIFCTMFDHAGPADPGGVSDPVLRLASISRELAANDFQYGFASKGAGENKDRNVELIVKAPFALSKRGKRKHGAPAHA